MDTAPQTLPNAHKSEVKLATFLKTDIGGIVGLTVCSLRVGLRDAFVESVWVDCINMRAIFSQISLQETSHVANRHTHRRSGSSGNEYLRRDLC